MENLSKLTSLQEIEAVLAALTPEIVEAYGGKAFKKREEGEEIVGAIEEFDTRRLFVACNITQGKSLESRGRAQSAYDKVAEGAWNKEASRYEEMAFILNKLFWMQVEMDIDDQWGVTKGVRLGWEVVKLTPQQALQQLR